jgi:cytochrome c5
MIMNDKVRTARCFVSAAAIAVALLPDRVTAQAPKDLTAERSGEQIVKMRCAQCHQTGAGGAPRIGDRAAWAPRLTQGLDLLTRSAIRGHGDMPARGGIADTTDGEIRSAILYMFNPGGRVPGEPAATAAKPPAKPGGKHVTVAGMEIYLGLTPAEVLRGYPKEAAERNMHGGVPAGAGQYHVNVSLFEARTGAAIADAQVEVRIEEVGMTSESKRLESMAIKNAPSYGAYFRLRGKTAYRITVRVKTPDVGQPVEARFEHRTS